MRFAIRNLTERQTILTSSLKNKLEKYECTSMRRLNAGDKCTQVDLNSKLIGDLFLIINVFSFSLKEQTSFRTEITVPQIHIYTLKAIIQKVILYYISKR